jgi:hypothetical protein
VIIGVVLSVPLINRRWTLDGLQRKLLAYAGAGLVADIVLKALLAPAWQRLLYQWVFQPAR